MAKAILDTDIGYDPDDFFALLLAQKLPNLDIDLIVTADEIGGKRAIFTKMILDQIGWTKPKLVQGIDLGNKDFLVDNLIKDKKYKIDTDFIESIKQTVYSTKEQVIYIGIGGFTNLAHFLKKYNGLKERLKIFIMGGALNYFRYENWIEHNIKIDIKSAKYVLESDCDISLIMAQTTFRQEYEISDIHPIFKKLKASTSDTHQMLINNSKLFNEYLKEKGMNGWSRMHDPLTLAIASGEEFVTFHKSKILISDEGQITINPSGSEIKWSDPISKCDEFMLFLEKMLFK